MKVLQLLLNQFPVACETDITWLKEVFTFIKDEVCPTLPPHHLFMKESHCSEREDVCDDSNSTVDNRAFHLTLSLLKKIQELKCSTNTISLNYRLVSATELLSHQRLACVSNLSRKTNQQKAGDKAEIHLSGRQPLPSVNLLLVGCLRTGVNGDWMLTDRWGNVRCECLCPCPLWLNHPIFLPHWNYIPCHSEEKGAAGGHLELIAPPVLLSDSPSSGPAPSSGFEHRRVISVLEASGILCNRTRGQRISVFGKVSSVSPLLVIAGTCFFCLSLTDDTQTLPIIVKESTKLWWNHCISVGKNVCLTALRVCTLRAWRRNSLLCVTEQSEMIYDQTQKHDVHNCSQSDPQSNTALSLMSVANQRPKPAKQMANSNARVKHSKLISYQGTVTDVVSEGAGLYIIDNKVGLCLAYQPSLRRNLRSGDVIELHNVHFLYTPCPDFPPIMLCTCLHSTLRVKTFSKVMASEADCACPGDGVLPKLLLENNIGVSEYLWTCHQSSQLRRSLFLSLAELQYCVCELSWKLMEHLLRCGQPKKRDIYGEMLEQPHSCVLNQYHVDHAVYQSISVSELTESLQSECWSSLCIRSQLSSVVPGPADAGCSSIQINSALSWSYRILTSDARKSVENKGALRQRPLLVIGILELPSQPGGHSLSLRDGTGTIGCVLTEAGPDGQMAAYNTAWIGCLVCVHQFDMVMERMLQSDFPSDQHLQHGSLIKHRECRVYLQFSLDHVCILSPSVSMVTHLHNRDIDAETKQKCNDFSTVTTTTTCHSLVIRVDQKEGVTLKNMRGEPNEESWLTPCFTVKVTVIGPVVCWKQDPKNCQMIDKEVGIGEKVMLICSGVSSCWFPMFQPGVYYRLVTRNAQSSTILTGVSVSAKSDPTLQVQPGWRFYTLTQPLLLSKLHQIFSFQSLTISEVLESSLEVVCFQGMVSERIHLNDRTADQRLTYSGTRLTMFDQSGRSLRVYIDLTNTPYLLGLLPGNTLLLSGFQRRLSKSGSVYCSYLPISSVTVVTLGNNSSVQPPPAPPMLIGQWALREDRDCAVGQVKGHVVCCLSLQLHWSCSVCGNIYTMAADNCQCLMSSALFNSKAKLVIEDGTGEAHVWFSGQQVQSLLGMGESEWEGLQRALRTRGHIRVLPQGQNMISTTDDLLQHFLEWLCSSKVACRLLTLTCRKFSNQTWRRDETKLFSRGDRNFMTRHSPALQLACVHLHELV
ncbi:CST complex subunit CTC1 isoform 1-T2 [Synchiropus picturatus]